MFCFWDFECIKLSLFSKSINLFKFTSFLSNVNLFSKPTGGPNIYGCGFEGPPSPAGDAPSGGFLHIPEPGRFFRPRAYFTPSAVGTVGTQGFIESKTRTGRKGSPLTPSPRFRTQGGIPGHSPPLYSLQKNHGGTPAHSFFFLVPVPVSLYIIYIYIKIHNLYSLLYN